MNANRPVKIILLFIIFLALIFYFFVLEKIENNDFITCKILKINSASEFYLDKNNDNLIDDDELVRLDNVVAFKPFLSYETRNYAKKLNFDMEKYLMAGFIAQKFADENLLNSEVKISKKYIKNKNSDVEVYFKGQNLGVFLLKNGLGFVDVDKNDSKTTYYKNFENLNKALDNAEKISNLKFSIVNLRTNVVHKLNCPHIKDIKNAVLVLENSAFYTRNHFCRVCYIEIPKYQTFDYEILKNKYSYNKTFYVKSNEIELYFINPVKFNTPSKNCSNDVCKRIIKEIDSANDSIELALYGFGEQSEIYEALKNAKSRGVKIEAVVDYSKNSDKIYPNTLKFINEFGAKTDDSENLMHNKFMIFDNKTLLTGSMNISASGSGGYNSNNVILIKDKNIIDSYKKEFQQMYEGKFSIFKKKIVKNNTENDEIKVYFSPKDDILNSLILPEIKKSKDVIFVSIFYLTDKDMIKELIDAKNRGVRVYVIADALFANNFKDRIAYLRQNNIATIVENWGGKNHEKTIMIDYNKLILGSCNFSKSGFFKNDENVLLINNSTIAQKYGDYFLYLFNSVDKRYLTRIPRTEGFESKNSCYDGLDNNFDGNIDSDDDGCKNTLR